MISIRTSEKPNTAPGFTLLEVLIALFIFALMVSAVFAAYRGTLNLMDGTESQENTYQMARIAMERIAEDLVSAYSPETNRTADADETSSGPTLLQGEKSPLEDLRCGQLRFLSLAHLTFSEEKSLAEPTEIAYYGVTGIDEDLFDLYRSDTPLTRERPEPATGGLILCKGLSSLDFIYYDAQGESHEDWNPEEGASKKKFPSRVSIMMEFPNRTDPKRPFKFMTGVAIPMGGLTGVE